MEYRHEAEYVPLNDVERRRVRRYSNTVIAVILGISALGLITGLVMGRHHRDRDAESAALVASVVLLAVGVIIGLTIRVLYAKPRYSDLLRQPWGQRRRVGKALRKGDPISDEDMPSAAALVALMRRQWWLPWVYTASALLWGVQAAAESHERRLHLVTAVLWALAVVTTIHSRRRILRNWDRLPNRDGYNEA
jgi:heme A synthase